MVYALKYLKLTWDTPYKMLGAWRRENTTAHAKLHSFFAQGLSHLEIEGATPSTPNP